ncbi:MAG: GNAT family N-acetyltransferase [Betaproteobacteria bacterium HGW-Betaproteobacteria-22]|nr:MAG: GNAT family N-acetyltransferase [Betaproteobacteria bacterium HGW-Betaproteobacteria-22]
MNSKYISQTPWDSKVFGLFTAEINTYSEEAIQACYRQAGLYTLKLNPLADKSLANKHGFYYCDTLLQPVCKRTDFVAFENLNTSISLSANNKEALLNICLNAFTHGRFHRDFHITKQQADQRYVNWLGELIDNHKVFSLLYQGELAGFIATKNNQLLLHAIAENFRGQGLAKYWWSGVCRTLFEQGFETVESSISASNLAVVNLYASLGFKTQSATDVYHKFVE